MSKKSYKSILFYVVKVFVLGKEFFFIVYIVLFFSFVNIVSHYFVYFEVLIILSLLLYNI